jgi:hypothetical protein
MNTTHRPYRQDADQRERADILKNDLRQNTMHGRASAELDLENTGRFAKPHALIGEGAPEYPRLPENSWTNDPTGVEPSLGIDVNAVEPCGEKFEIEALGDATTETVVDQSVASPLAAAVASSEVSASPADVERAAAIPNPKPRSLR